MNSIFQVFNGQLNYSIMQLGFLFLMSSIDFFFFLLFIYLLLKLLTIKKKQRIN
jgi:hypothetical protein